MTAQGHTATRLALSALVAALIVFYDGTTSASAAGDPILVAPGGCALQCIETALVTTTASSAKVEIVTSVPTKIVVSALRFGVAGAPVAMVSQQTFRTSRTVHLAGLQPETTYRIVLSAVDGSGRTMTRSGTFKTRPVETAVDSGPGGLSSGLGCSVHCITKAVPVQIGPTAAVFEIATDTPARLVLVVSYDAAGHDVASTTTSPPATTRWTTAASPLAPGTTYHFILRATDSSGRVEQRHFTFKTVERKAQITFWKIKVIDDGDKGPVSGELGFDYWLGGKQVGYEGFHKRSSGDVFQVRAPGSSRPGLTGTLAANGANPQLDVRVFAEECDGPALMKNCTTEARTPDWTPSGGGEFGDDNDYATAGGLFGLSALLAPLPGNYGSILPSGHSAYLVFETTQYHVKFRVYAYVDYFFDW